jgi:hypothetical protein
MEKKQLLERILLNMSYNSSKTYSENLEIIKEQSQTTIGAAKPKNVRKSYEDYLKEVPQLPPSRLSTKIKNDIYFCSYPRNYDFYKITTNLTRNDGDIFFNRNDNNIDVYCNKLQNLYPDDFSSIQNVKNKPTSQKTNIPLDNTYRDKWYDENGNVLVYTDNSKSKTEYQKPTVNNANLRVCGAPRGYTCEGWEEFNGVKRQIQDSYQKCKTSNKGKLILPTSVKNMLPKQKIELYESGMADESSIQNTCQSKFTSLNDFVKLIFYNYEFPHGIEVQNLTAYKELYGEINKQFSDEISSVQQQDNYGDEDNPYALPTDRLDPNRDTEKLKQTEINKLKNDKNILLQGLDLTFGFDDSESPESLTWYQNFYKENQLVIDLAGFVATEAALAAITRGMSLESTVTRAPAIIGRQAFLETSKFVASQALKQKLKSVATPLASSLIWFGGVVNGVLLPKNENEAKQMNWILAFFPLFKMFPGVDWLYKGIGKSLQESVRKSILKKAQTYLSTGGQTEWVTFFSKLNKPEKLVMINLLKENVTNPQAVSNLIKQVSLEATKNIESKQGFSKILSIIQNSAKGNLAASENQMLLNTQKVFNTVGGAAGKQGVKNLVKTYGLDALFITVGSIGNKVVTDINQMLKNQLDNQKIEKLQNWLITYENKNKVITPTVVENTVEKFDDSLGRIKSGKATAEDVEFVNDAFISVGIRREDLKNPEIKMSEEEYRKTREFYDDERFNNNDPSFVVFEVAPDTLTQKDNQ